MKNHKSQYPEWWTVAKEERQRREEIWDRWIWILLALAIVAFIAWFWLYNQPVPPVR